MRFSPAKDAISITPVASYKVPCHESMASEKPSDGVASGPREIMELLKTALSPRAAPHIQVFHQGCAQYRAFEAEGLP